MHRKMHKKCQLFNKKIRRKKWHETVIDLAWISACAGMTESRQFHGLDKWIFLLKIIKLCYNFNSYLF